MVATRKDDVKQKLRSAIKATEDKKKMRIAADAKLGLVKKVTVLEQSIQKLRNTRPALIEQGKSNKKVGVKNSGLAPVEQGKSSSKKVGVKKKSRKPDVKLASSTKLTKTNLDMFVESSEVPKPKRIRKKPASVDSGNTDDQGSVGSGLLDENICYQCGECTDDHAWDKLIMCDLCDGEYHFHCVGLEDLAPRRGWKCPKCLLEVKSFNGLDFSVKGPFSVPNSIRKLRKDGFKPEGDETCYSPSKPIRIAWEECCNKGFMAVSNVFPYDIMRKLTHGGDVIRRSKSGRITEQWDGVVAELSSKLLNSGHNLINRGGRFDMPLPLYVVEELNLLEHLEPILSRLSSIMLPSPVPKIKTHNIIFAPVGSACQQWHADDVLYRPSANGKHRYFTILIHLNPINSNCGGTEIYNKQSKTYDMVRGRPGDAFVFNGSLLHRGQANVGTMHRFFYYASFACRHDENADVVK